MREEKYVLTPFQNSMLEWVKNHPGPATELLGSRPIENRSNADVKTQTQVILPILGCLMAAEEYLQGEIWSEGKERKPDWTAVKDAQKEFLETFMKHMPVVDCLGDNLKRKANRDVGVINRWLKENGFDIQLDQPADGPATFAVASILDVLVEWIELGDKTSIVSKNTGETYKAVRLKQDKGVKAYLCSDEQHPNHVVRIGTKSKDSVFMTVLDSLPDGVFAISKKVEDLRRAKKDWVSVSGVEFPMVNYDSRVDISWILGMRTGSKPDDFFIEQALQQTKFRMNERGARAQSAVAMTFRCLSCAAPDPWVTIDRPFLLWIERQDVDIPLFAGVFAEDVWKEPEGLE